MAPKLNMVMFMIFVLATSQLQSSKAQTTYVVGDALGWLVPPGGPIAYSTWASLQNFVVGDRLLFNFTTGAHDVAEVTAMAFNACNATNPISRSTTGPTTITLRSAGSHYYICTVPQHCGLGQQLAINVSAASTTSPAPAPSPSATPPSPSTATPESAPAPTPSRARTTHVVGDRLGWNVLPAGAVAYQTWASNRTFVVGDTLVFNFVNRTHNVAELTRAAFNSCNTTTTLSLTTTSPARINLTTPGQHFFTCTFPNHCSLGQQLAINVTGTTTAATPPPSTIATPPTGTTTPSSPSPSGTTASPPAGSGSPSAVAGAALPAMLFAIIVAFLY